MKKVCPKCKGKGCSHCGGTGYHESMNKGGMMNKGMKALKKEAPEVAKKKFKVWPSAYASAWLTKTYKARGGKYSGTTKNKVS